MTRRKWWANQWYGLNRILQWRALVLTVCLIVFAEAINTTSCWTCVLDLCYPSTKGPNYNSFIHFLSLNHHYIWVFLYIHTDVESQETLTELVHRLRTDVEKQAEVIVFWSVDLLRDVLCIFLSIIFCMNSWSWWVVAQYAHHFIYEYHFRWLFPLFYRQLVLLFKLWP